MRDMGIEVPVIVRASTGPQLMSCGDSRLSIPAFFGVAAGVSER